MVKMNISVDNDVLQQLQSVLARIGAGSSPDDFPLTKRAMSEAAEKIRDKWMEYAGGGSLEGVEPLKHPKGDYAKSIGIEPKGGFDYEIYSDAKVAEWIEYGTERIDMKETHTKGPRSRIVKNGPNKGKSYLIVPFQWGTTSNFRNVVPKRIQRMMLSAGFKSSSVNTNKKQEENYSGEMVDRWTYDWGDRVRGRDIAGTIQQKTRIDGLVRFENGEMDGKRYGGYLTFRIIPSWGSGWIKPATAARNVTKALADSMRTEIEGDVGVAIQGDIAIL
jgi:hypothetical protein